MATTLISTADLAQRLASPRLVLIDVRHDLAHPEAWGEAQYRASHLPGAVFLHIDRDLAAPKTGSNGRHPLPSAEAGAAVFGRAGIDASTDVVAYDQGQGMYASRVWWMLRWLGHDRVAVLDGGFDKWQREGLPVTTEIAQPTARTFMARPRDAAVDAAGVRANLDTRALLLIDARAPERFRGEVEPLDPVAGRIPGAANRPGSRNLGADGTFKSPETLRAEFLALLGGRSPESIVHQCGSGITACHNLLAMEVAGLSGSRLYPGSWSEWCADPSRPIARGEP